jgi:hypothetical protein
MARPPGNPPPTPFFLPKRAKLEAHADPRGDVAALQVDAFESAVIGIVDLGQAIDVAAEIWGAELAVGDGPGRIYVVEPTGEIVDDANLTDKKFAGNPTKSCRSRAPLRVTGEIVDWQGHSSEQLRP